MSRMKTFFKYALWIIIFFIASEFLINVGLNSTYKDMARKDENAQVVIYQAQADSVSGRIRGIITNAQPEELSGKYICINFYSPREVFLGKHYIEVGNLEQNASKPFEVYFQLQEAVSYEVTIVNEKDPEATLIEVLKEELTKPERVLKVALLAILFW